MKRSRALKPLSSEHHQALLVAFQLKKGLAGHAEAAGAPKDLAGLLALAIRLEEQVLKGHARAEEELLAKFIAAPDIERLRADHAEMSRLLEAARGARAGEQRALLAGFAELVERHVRWEERELFPYAEGNADEATLETIAGELEKRLVMARSERRPVRR